MRNDRTSEQELPAGLSICKPALSRTPRAVRILHNRFCSIELLVHGGEALAAKSSLVFEHQGIALPWWHRTKVHTSGARIRTKSHATVIRSFESQILQLACFFLGGFGAKSGAQHASQTLWQRGGCAAHIEYVQSGASACTSAALLDTSCGEPGIRSRHPWTGKREPHGIHGRPSTTDVN